ncbi:MAG: His/Gly/Thr/Pro-type tRNA ligase C-terminal domain-containing protein [Pseudonocardiaceae bacterium]
MSTRMVRGLIICHGDDAGVRVVLDEQIDVNFGRRAIDAELKGIPVRVELGPRDIAAGRAMLVRRIPGTKEPVALTVRCLTRPDCSLPASGDEPDLIAWVGRSY